MSWVETTSLSFTARHESAQTDDAIAVLEDLEEHRNHLERAVPAPARERHGRPARLAAPALAGAPAAAGLAQPCRAARRGATWRAGTGPARCTRSRRPMLRALSAGPDSERACCSARGAPTRRWSWASTTRCCRRPAGPARVSPALLRHAWLAEGAAQYFSGQVPLLRAAIAMRLRQGRVPFPPGRAGRAAAGGQRVRPARARARRARLRAARDPSLRAPRATRWRTRSTGPSPDTAHAWRAHLERLSTPEPGCRAGRPPGLER